MDFWWPGREFNPLHADFQSAALPTELPGQTEPRIRQGRRGIVNYGIEINALRAGPAPGFRNPYCGNTSRVAAGKDAAQRSDTTEAGCAASLQALAPQFARSASQCR